MPVDSGFAQNVRRHVEEDGPAIMALAGAGDPALWDYSSTEPRVQALRLTGRIAAERQRSLDQARDLLRAGLGAAS